MEIGATKAVQDRLKTTDIEPRNWNYYTMYIRSVIHGVMQEMGYSEEQIGQYFKMSGDTTVTKTHGRKSVGGINRMVMDAQYFGKKLEKEVIFASQRDLMRMDIRVNFLT